MDADEFDAFYTISFSRLVNQVYAMIGNRDEAQDCVQEEPVLQPVDGTAAKGAWRRWDQAASG